MSSGSTTLSYSSGSSTIKNRIQFNNGGGTGLSFVAANQSSAYNRLITIQRTGIQQADLVDGDPFFSLTTSMKDLAGINTPSRITSLTVTYNWDTYNDAVWYETGQNAVYASTHFFQGDRIVMRWFGSTEPTSTFGRCQLILPTSTSPKYSPPTPVSYNGNFTPVQRLDVSGNLGVSFLNYPSKNQTYSFSFDGSYMDLLTEDTFTLKQPICLRIPYGQHSYDYWPFNAGKAMVYLQWSLLSITFSYTYDTILEYKGIFYSDRSSLTPGLTNLYKDPELTTLISPNGYVSDATNFNYVSGGQISNALRCQDTVAISSPTSGSGSVSSSYPYSASGYTSYSFNSDIEYVTLDASPNSGNSFVRWEATDFEDIVTIISYDSTINVYNGLYASIKPVFAVNTPPPPPPPPPPPSVSFTVSQDCVGTTGTSGRIFITNIVNGGYDCYVGYSTQSGSPATYATIPIGSDSSYTFTGVADYGGSYIVYVHNGTNGQGSYGTCSAFSCYVAPPPPPPPPSYPDYGTLLSDTCSVYDRVLTYANGSGGSYTNYEYNSSHCSYVPPSAVFESACYPNSSYGYLTASSPYDGTGAGYYITVNGGTYHFNDGLGNPPITVSLPNGNYTAIIYDESWDTQGLSYDFNINCAAPPPPPPPPPGGPGNEEV
jgi:hypothetical protein